MIRSFNHNVRPVEGLEPPAQHGERRISDSGLMVTSREVSGADNDRTIITTPEWSAHQAQSHTLARQALTAEWLRARVVGVDNPGVGSGTLTREERAAIARGDYPQTTAQWEALHEIGFSPAEVTFFGYSQGAAGAAALMASAPDDVVARRLVLWEAAGIEERGALDLGRAFAAEQARWGAYKKENPEWFKQQLKKAGAKTPLEIAAHPKAPLAYARSLASASILPNLRKAFDNGTLTSDTEVIIINGDKSRVSPSDHNEQLGAALVRGLGHKAITHFILMDEAHGLIDSLPRYANVLDIIDNF